MKSTCEELYPSFARWVEEYGWIEIGQDSETSSFVRAFDTGGLVWEGSDNYKTLDEAFRALDAALSDWIREDYGDE